MANYKVLATWDISIQNLYKDITLIQQGISCKLNISLRSISRVIVNYKVGNEYVTDLCTIDLDNNKVIVPFKKNVLEVGTHALELVCHMKNGDVLPTPNYSYTVTKSLTNDNDITEEDAYPVLIGMIEELTKNEAVLQANEEARANAEMYRELNEDERQNAEAERKANENTRISNENIRQSNESNRQQYETQRRVEEDERLTDEQVRVNAENIRIANENERLRKEIERQNAEELRQIAYNSSLYARMDEAEDRLDAVDSQLAQTTNSIKKIQNEKLNFIEISNSYEFEEIKSILENSENCVIVFENGVYTFDDEILFENKSNITINFNYSQILLNQVVGMKSVFKFINSNNIEFSNVIIDGNRTMNGSNEANQDGGNHGLSINNSTNLVFNNVNAIKCGTDGVYIGNINSTDRMNSNLLFKNCLFDENSRQGASILEGENITFISCEFVNTNGKTPQSGVDIEPLSRTRYIKNIHFQDCNFENNQGRGLMQHNSAENSIDTVTFDNCKIINNNNDDLTFTTKTSLSYLDNIRITSCEIGSLTISGIASDKNVNVSINDSKIRFLKNAPNILFTLNNSEIGSVALYEALKVYNCVFDSGYLTRDCIYQYDPPVNGTSVFQNCIFGQYQRYNFMQISDCLIDNCLFKSPPSDEFSTVPCIEPIYQEECNLLIRSCTFLGNSVRFPDKTSGVTVINSGGVKAIPSTTDRNKSINCYTI